MAGGVQVSVLREQVVELRAAGHGAFEGTGTVNECDVILCREIADELRVAAKRIGGVDEVGSSVGRGREEDLLGAGAASIIVRRATLARANPIYVGSERPHGGGEALGAGPGVGSADGRWDHADDRIRIGVV